MSDCPTGDRIVHMAKVHVSKLCSLLRFAVQLLGRAAADFHTSEERTESGNVKNS